MDSIAPFGIAQAIGMIIGGIVAHLAVDTYQKTTAVTVKWGDNDAAQLEAPADIIQQMHVFSRVKDAVHPHMFDRMCYQLQTLYSTLRGIAHSGPRLTHDQLYQCQGIIERVVSLGSDFLRHVMIFAPEEYDEMESAYTNLEHALEQEAHTLQHMYEQQVQ